MERCGVVPKIKQGLPKLHPLPGPTSLGNTAPGFGLATLGQLIKVGSSEKLRKLVMLPAPGVTPSADVVGFRFRPPPLNMKVRIEGCSKISPPPARSTVLPVPKISQAKPRRGETLL